MYDNADEIQQLDKKCQRWTWFSLHIFVDVLVVLVIWNSMIALVQIFTMSIDQDTYLMTCVGLSPTIQWTPFGLFVYYLWSTLFAFALIGLITIVIFGRSSTFVFDGDTNVGGWFVFMLVIIIAFVGMVVGGCIAVHWFASRAQKHVKQIWRLSEVRQLRVKDLSTLSE
jgi:hypothetical protein